MGAVRLFVYGSLRVGAGQPLGARLAREARLLGGATCPGILYDTGPWPAATPAMEENDFLYGELYELKGEGAQALLRDLDEYEGCDSGDDEKSLFARRIVPVTTAGGVVLEACVYFYNRGVSGFQRVESGDWLRRE